MRLRAERLSKNWLTDRSLVEFKNRLKQCGEIGGGHIEMFKCFEVVFSKNAKVLVFQRNKPREKIRSTALDIRN